MKLFSTIVLKIMGWDISYEIPKNIKKAIIIVAPHTSLWDTVIGKLGFWHLGIDTKILIKEEAFKGPLGFILKKLGGMPVNRSKSTKLTTRVAQMFNERNSLFITITPEGTRTLVKQWKQGFYYIALEAKVPIIIGVLDYEHKVGIMKDMFYPTGDYSKDIVKIHSYYRGVMGKNSKGFDIFD